MGVVGIMIVGNMYKISLLPSSFYVYKEGWLSAVSWLSLGMGMNEKFAALYLGEINVDSGDSEYTCQKFLYKDIILYTIILDEIEWELLG